MPSAALSAQNDTLTTQQALALLGVSRTTLYAIMRRGELSPVSSPTKARRRPALRFRRQDVEELAEPVTRAS